MAELDRLQVTFLGNEPPSTVPWMRDPTEVTPPSRGTYSTQREQQDAVTFSPVEVPDAYSILDEAISNGASLEGVQNAQAKNDEVRNALSYINSFSAVDSALAEDPLVAGEVFKVQTRFGKAQDTLMDYAEEAMDDGTFGKILEVIDMLGYFTLDDLMSAPRALKGEGGSATEISEIYLDAAHKLSDEEYDLFVMDRVDKLQTSLLHGSENSYIIMRELEAIAQSGFILYDRELSAIASGFAVAEVAPFALRGSIALGKLGRSTYGRLRGTAGSTTATEAALNSDIVLRSGRTGEVLDAQNIIEDLTGAISDVERKATPFKDSGPRISPHVEDAEIIDDIVPSSLRSNDTAPTPPPPIAQGRFAGAISENQLVRQFIMSEQRNSFGAANNIGSASQWAAEQTARVSDQFSRPLIDTGLVNEGMQNYRYSATLGRADGLAFKSYASASRLSDKIPSANVVDMRTGKLVTGDTGSGEFGVLMETRYSVKSGINPENMAEVAGANWFRRTFGKASGISPDFVNNLADAAEFGGLGFKRHFQNLLRDVTNMNSSDYKALDSILTSLRDAPDMAGRREWFDIADVGRAYENLTGKPITNKVLKAYERVVELSDFSYFVEASKRLQDLAAQDAVVVKFKNGVETLAFPRGTVPDEAWVFDIKTNTRMRGSNVDDTLHVFQVNEKLADGSTYVTNISNSNRLPELNDALGYNAGGHRTNPYIQHFIGTFQEGRWTTLMGARTSKEADKGIAEWNNIIDSLNGKVPADVTRLDREYINGVIRANNTWNPDIEDLDDVTRFAKTRGIKLDEKVVAKERGTTLGEELIIGDRSLINISMEKLVRYNRQDEVLLEFGGKRAQNPDPLLSIVNRFSRAVTEGAQTQYKLEHTTAWASALRKAIKDNKIAAPNLPLGPVTDESLLRRTEIIGNTPLAVKFRAEQEVILRRLGLLKGSVVDTVGSKITGVASTFGNRLLEAVYNRPILRTIDQTMLNIFKFDAKGAKEFVLDNGSAKMMSLGFIEKMTAPDNFFLQSTHALSIVYASGFGGSLNGFRGAFLGASLRMAAQKGSDSAWFVMNKRLASLVGVSDDVFGDLVSHLKDSGRGYMKGAVADDPNARALASRGLGRVKNALAIPFYAGENYAATTSRIVAFLDVHKANPSLGTTSKTFWNKVQARDRDLSFAMNSANRSGMQSDDVGRVLGQWESFRMAAIEHVFFNKTLSKMERTGFAVSLTASYGALGLGVYGVASEVIPESWGADVKELILHGPSDYILRNTLGIGMGSRISPIAGVTPWQGTLDKLVGLLTEPTETIPSTKLGGETLKRFSKVVADAFSLKPPTILAYDAARLARVMKIVDSNVMAYEMMMEDTRTTATGGRIPHEYDSIQEFMQALGFTPKEATDVGLAGNLIYNLKGRRDRAIKESKNYFTRSLQYMAKGDYDTAEYFFLEGNAVIDAYGFSPTHRNEVLGSSFGKTGMERLEFMLNEMLKAGLTPSPSLTEAVRR